MGLVDACPRHPAHLGTYEDLVVGTLFCGIDVPEWPEFDHHFCVGRILVDDLVQNLRVSKEGIRMNAFLEQ